MHRRAGGQAGEHVRACVFPFAGFVTFSDDFLSLSMKQSIANDRLKDINLTKKFENSPKYNHKKRLKPKFCLRLHPDLLSCNHDFHTFISHGHQLKGSGVRARQVLQRTKNLWYTGVNFHTYEVGL